MAVERVQPIEGASVVVFDYDAADDALAAVERTLPETLGGQVEPRRTAGSEAATDWSGHFRGEFDRAESSLLSRLTDGAAWGPLGPANEVYAAAGRANDQQRAYNQDRRDAIAAAEEEREREDDNVPQGSGPS